MAVTIDSGLQATDDPLGDDLVQQMDKQVANQDVDTTQFTTILMKLASNTSGSFKEEWMEDVFIPKNTALAASATSAATVWTITTSEGSYGKPGDVVLVVQTGEHARIVTAAASSWTVVRSIGSTAAATAATGTGSGGLVIVAGSNEEGAEKPTALVTQKTANFNYHQIVRNSYRFTATTEWTQWHSGNPLAYNRRKIAVEHKRELENIGFLGVRSYDTSGGEPRCTAGGLDNYISTNITDIAGTMDKAEFADFLRSGMEFGDRNRKVLFASPIVAQVLSEFLQDNWVRARPEDNVWGVKVDAIIDPAFTGNKIPVFVKSDWKRYGEGTGKHLGSRAYLIDMSNVSLWKAPATNAGPRYAALYRKRHNNSADETAEEYLSDITFKVKVEKSHAVLRGVTG